MIIAMEICKILKDNGYQSYLVGGFVRDLILGKSSSDIDIATDAPPNGLLNMFSKEHFKAIPTGIAHGTVTVIHEHLNPNKGYEITVFRKDVSCDGRYAKVEFINDLIEDLTRRDFTINAIAYDPFNNKFIDPYNGIADIHNKIIQCVGNPHDRFKEDYLRMLRAFRFAATLGFTLDTATEEAIYLLGGNIKNISIERIKSEIDKCFNKSDEPSVMFYMLYQSHLLNNILPELEKCYGFLQNKYHKHDVFRHTMEAIDAVPKEYPLIRWAALFHDLGKVYTCTYYSTPEASFHNHEYVSEEIARKIMTRLKFSNDDIEYVCNLVKHHMFMASMEMKDSAIRRFVNKLGEEYVDDICILKWADMIGNGLKEPRGGVHWT